MIDNKTSLLFIVDDFYPIKHAPAVRISSFIEKLKNNPITLLGGIHETIPKDRFSFKIKAIKRPSEQKPFYFALFLLKLASKSLSLSKKHNYDCIIISVPKYELLFFSIFLKKHTKLLILDFRDSLDFLDYEAYFQNFFPKIIARPLGCIFKFCVSKIIHASCKRADLITTANSAIKKSLPHHSTPTHTVSNGVDTHLFRSTKPLTVALPIKLAYVGNFSEKDRFDTLIEGLTPFREHFEIHLFGEGRGKAKALFQLKQANIFFVDKKTVAHQELPKELSETHVGIIFRDEKATESIPVALYEFCSLNRPVIVNNVGIMSNFVKDNNLGWVVQDSQDLKKIFYALQKNPKAIENFPHLEQLAKNEFSRNKQSDKMFSILDELINKSLSKKLS